ncbi:UNVERIFIED_CONTAM: hypothetical protein Scaly_0466800 [Sesamum calycinum]|uniref:Uncharacterized protein n=1 Tax=Sesamum calycinum TaxID=2727403 RepID=A0AAW2SF78_9LAMI
MRSTRLQGRVVLQSLGYEACLRKKKIYEAVIWEEGKKRGCLRMARIIRGKKNTLDPSQNTRQRILLESEKKAYVLEFTPEPHTIEDGTKAELREYQNLHELMNMLKTIESTFKKKKHVLLVGSSSNSKDIKPKKWKGKKGNGSFKKNIKRVSKVGQEIASSIQVSQLQQTWALERNCKNFLADRQNGQVMASKELSEESTVLKLGNGVVVATLAIGMVHLVIGIIDLDLGVTPIGKWMNKLKTGADEELVRRVLSNALWLIQPPKVEYIAACDATKEVVLIKNFIQEFDVIPSVVDPTLIYCGNIGAVVQEKESRSHQRVKHIMSHFYRIR